MAKRRNKNKAKRRLAGLDRRVKINGEIVKKMLKKEGQNKNVISGGSDGEGSDPGGEVQITESGILTESDLNKSGVDEYQTDDQIKLTLKPVNGHKRIRMKKCKNNIDLGEEVLISPTEVDGETCIEITCGNNDATLFLSKLCLGSKGACILFSDSWYTPNEFQTVSGRETAKDWKRSIRHKGRSLKLLISKGLINVQAVSPKKTGVSKGVAPHKDNTVASTPLSDGKDNDGKASPGEQAIKQDTKPAENKPKRGRKPKKFRQRNALKARQLAEAKTIVDEPETTVPASSEEAMHESKDENEIKSESQADPRTDEERRFDEFVKTLRLTKATAPKLDPDVPAVPNVTEIPEPLADPNIPGADPEMPVLQKEEDFRPEAPENVHPENDENIDTALHAAVTPPPTPPAEKIDVKEDDIKLNETFKSRLASPGNGLKLTINREKIIPVTDTSPKLENSDQKTDPIEEIDDSKQSVAKSSLQTMLLHDALKSAKKYKEKLKQNPKTVSVKPIIQVPKVSTPDDKPEQPKVLPVFPSSDSKISLKSKEADFKYQKDMKQTAGARHVPGIYRTSEPSRQTHVPGLDSHSVLRELSKGDFSHLAGMSFQDFLGVLSSIYGPLPFPVNSNESAFAALQEMQRRHDMLRFLTQGQMDPSSPAFMYSMITQQILLAMTQQLFSTCNKTDWPSSQKCDSLKPDWTNSLKPEPDWTTLPPRSIVHNTKDNVPFNNLTINSHIPVQGHEVPCKKRKYPEERTSSDGALDLSMKKPKMTNQCTAAPSMPKHDFSDAPLDFSMKKTTYTERCFYKASSPVGTLNSSQRVGDSAVLWSNHTNGSSRPKALYCRCIDATKDDITKWSVDRVCEFLRNLDGCAQYTKTFHEQGINGRLLPYLTTQHLTRTLGMKVGPALTFLQAVDQRLKDRRPSVCRECKLPLMPLLMTAVKS